VVYLEIAVAVLAVLVGFLIVKNLQWRMRFEKKVNDWLIEKESEIRKDAAERSGRTLSGKALEKLVPFLEKFPYDPHDVKWLGDPVDLVIFDGYSNGRDPKKVVFCEVKSGDSDLSQSQKKIKRLVDEKKVEWIEFRPEK
jgi:predicted Holliday junction resolvase-like endonuclease